MPPLSPDPLASSREEGRNVLTVNGSLDPANSTTELRLPDGRIVQLSTAALLGGKAADSERVEAEQPARIAAPETAVLSLAEERLHVGHRTVETGKVRLHTSVQTFETQLDEVLAVRSFDVERIVLNQPVDAAPQVRQEGDTTIYPLVEEQLIVTRQLVLREELRVTRRDSQRHDTRPVTLRREVIAVERSAPPLESLDRS